MNRLLLQCLVTTILVYKGTLIGNTAAKTGLRT